MGKKLKDFVTNKGRDLASIIWGSIAIMVFHYITWKTFNEMDFSLIEWVGAYCMLHSFVFGGEALKEKYIRRPK